MAEGLVDRDSQKSLRSFRARVESFANVVSAIVNRYWYIVAALFTAGYFVDTFFRASRKLLWFDEIFTLSVARLPDLKSLWHVLMQGIEFNPPLLYVLTGFSNKLLGENPVSIRLPEIVGFWIFCACLFGFVSKRSSAMGGFISMLFPMVTLAYWYAYEARPYGIELAFCGIALVCWQAAADRASGRLLWLLGLILGLAGALLTHGYGFLVFFPLVIGEIVRAIQRGRADWPVWIAMAISSVAILVSIPLTAALRAIVIPATVTHASVAGLVSNYIAYFKPTAYVLIGWLALMCVTQKRRTLDLPWSRGARIYELAALAALFVIPMLQSVVAKLTGAPPIARYSIFWLAGPACLLGLVSATRPVLALGTICILLAQIGADAVKFRRSSELMEPSTGHPIDTSFAQFGERYQWMDAVDTQTLPIALLNSFDFLPTAFYAPHPLASRLTYVMASKADLNGIFYARLRPCCSDLLGPPVNLSDFLAAHKTFLAFGGPLELPVMNYLVERGATVTLRKVSPDHFLVLVTQ